MMLSRAEGHLGLDCLFRVQGQNVFIIVKYFMFFQIFEIFLLQQIISYLDHLVVVVDMAVHQSVEIRLEPANQLLVPHLGIPEQLFVL